MQPKNNGKQKSAPRKSPKKAEPGAFWVLEGMRTVKGRCKRMGKPGVRTKVNPIPVQHRQKENRRKPSVFAGFWQGQKDLSRLPPRSALVATGDQRPTTRTAQGAAVPRCQILPHTNEKSQVSQKRYLTFLCFLSKNDAPG